MTDLEERVQRLEDQLAIYQVVCSYGYAADGCNAEVLGEIYAEDGVYQVNDSSTYVGRGAVQGIVDSPGHLALVSGGAAHMSTLPFVVIDGDRAVATCHTMVPRRAADASYVIARLSASRIELERGADGRWRITHRTNQQLDGDPLGRQMLARLADAPDGAS
jgi:ketosteroid isomerase-like protein